MSFEIVFITEGPIANPAAEIQFGGQRLCIVRFASAASPEIEFVRDLYVGRDAKMIFPLEEFLETLQLAVDDLASWRRKLADGPASGS